MYVICIHADIPTYAATHCTCKRMRQAQRVPLPNADPQAFAPHRHNPGAVRFDNPTALRQQHFEARHGPCVNDSHPRQILALLAALTLIAALSPTPPGSRQGQVRRGLAVDALWPTVDHAPETSAVLNMSSFADFTSVAQDRAYSSAAGSFADAATRAFFPGAFAFHHHSGYFKHPPQRHSFAHAFQQLFRRRGHCAAGQVGAPGTGT